MMNMNECQQSHNQFLFSIAVAAGWAALDKWELFSLWPFLRWTCHHRICHTVSKALLLWPPYV